MLGGAGVPCRGTQLSASCSLRSTTSGRSSPSRTTCPTGGPGSAASSRTGAGSRPAPAGRSARTRPQLTLKPAARATVRSGRCSSRDVVPGRRLAFQLLRASASTVELELGRRGRGPDRASRSRPSRRRCRRRPRAASCRRRRSRRLYDLVQTGGRVIRVRPPTLLPSNPVSARAPKYVFVTGGVVSALGKGIVAASLGRLLKARGLRVQLQKFDPYLNVDPGTMSPFQHGEVFVTEDGAETDLDIGHYERFVDENLLAQREPQRRARSGTRVLRKERKGEFLGATVQVIPHITNEIKARIRARRRGRADADVVISEIGGTVGDIESLPFLEAIRQFRREVGPGERRLRPRDARAVHRGGRRAEDEADAALGERAAAHRYPSRRRRLPLARGAVAGHPRQDRALRRRRPGRGHRVPRRAATSISCRRCCRRRGSTGSSASGSGSRRRRPTSASGTSSTSGIDAAARDRRDRARRQVREAPGRVPLRARGAQARRPAQRLRGPRALGRRREHVVRGGGGACSTASTACSSPAASARAAGRGRSSPARSRARRRSRTSASASACTSPSPSSRATSCGLDGANSTEMDPETPYPVIDLLPEQKGVEDLGGTMRLGAQAVEVAEGTQRARAVRRRPVIFERHRHRYEVNNLYREQLVDAGLVVSGTFEEGGSSRSSSCRTIRGSSRASSTRSSSRGRRGRRRSSAGSSRAALARARGSPADASARRGAYVPEVDSTSSSSWRRSRARRARSAPSPTSCSATCATSASSRTRTTRAAIGSTMGTSTQRSSRPATATPLFFCAHLDTVPPDGPLEPVVEDGVVRNAGGTILGADNKAAVAAMLEACPARARREPAARGHRAAVHAEGGGRAPRRGRVRPHAAARAARLRLRPGGADRRDHPRRAVGAAMEVTLPRPRRALGHVPRGGPLGDPGGGEGDRRPAARAGRRGDDRERRRRSPAAPRRTSSRSGARSSREARSPRRAQARRARAGDARRVHVRRDRGGVRGRDEARARATAATASRKSDVVVRLAAEALERCGFEPTLRALRRRRRRERLQRARAAVRQPRERR